MALDPILLGRRLRDARSNRHLSQGKVAEEIGIPRTALLQIEAGRRSLSTLELAKLAKLYQMSAADFFLEDGGEPARAKEDALVVIHQRLPKGLLKDPAITKEVDRCIELCKAGVELEALLGKSSCIALLQYEVPSPARLDQATDQGEKVANSERSRLGLGHSPIADMADLISTQGIWASGVRLPDQMSGLFLNHPDIRMAILVNFEHAKQRKRFSYAHEYAHALFDRDRSMIISDQKSAHDLIERRANAFAAAFLMPAEGVAWFLQCLDKGGLSRRQRVTYSPAGDDALEAEERPAPGSQKISFQDVAALADYFNVSYQAAVYRLNDLQYINADAKRSLIERQQQLGGRYGGIMSLVEDPETEMKPDRELVSHVLRLAIEAGRRGELTHGQVRDLSSVLQIPIDELTELTEAASD